MSIETETIETIFGLVFILLLIMSKTRIDLMKEDESSEDLSPVELKSNVITFQNSQ